VNLILAKTDAPCASVRCITIAAKAGIALIERRVDVSEKRETCHTLGYRTLAVIGCKPWDSLQRAAVNAGKRPSSQTRQWPWRESVGDRHVGADPGAVSRNDLRLTRVLGGHCPSNRTANAQPVVKVWRRTETGEAPRRQGATTENTGSM
jgi:hypothetical protein